MNEDDIREPAPSRVSRRAFLGTVGTAAAAVAAGSALGVPAGPVIASSKKLTILKWSHFVPAYDTWFTKFAQDWGKKHGVDVSVDMVETNTVVTHASSEVAAGTGHDITELQNDTHVALFKDHIIDLTGLVDKIGKAHGGWIKFADFARYGHSWKAIPNFFIPYIGLYRKDLYDANHLKPSDTWDEVLAAGKVLKPKGHPVGIAVSSTYDSNAALYSILWSYGGKFVEKDGKTVAIKSAQTKKAIEYVTKLYNDAMTSEVLSWNDASNNRYIDSGVGSYISNPISAYRSASTDMQKNIYMSQTPKGPASRSMGVVPYSYVIWKWSKVKPEAKAFLTAFYASYKQAFVASTGYNMPMLHGYLKKPMPILGHDPKLKVLQDVYKYVKPSGWPGPSNQAAGQVYDTFVIPTMFAKAARGESPESAMSWAESQLKSIYSKYS